MKWDTPFGSWLSGYGVSRLVTDLRCTGQQVSDKAVYQWVNGDTVPRPKHAQALLRLSNGSLSMEQIYGHRDQLQQPETRERDGQALAHS